MSRRTIYLLTVLLAAEAILVNGRPPRFPSNEGKDLLETVRIVRTKVR